MATSNSRKREASKVEWLENLNSTVKRHRAPQTCEWILDEPKFRDWKDSSTPTSVLWIYGPPGCGKSFLAQYIVEHLRDLKDFPTTISYFCDAYSTPASIAQSFLAQILREPRVKELQRNALAEALTTQQPGMDEGAFLLWDRLYEWSRSDGNFVAVVDGLDEMQKKFYDQEFNVLGRLRKLVSWSGKLLILSRTEPYIQEGLSSFPKVKITASKVKHDLEKFIASEISRHSKLQPHIERIGSVLLPEADGIFLWASLVIQALAAENDEQAMLKELESPKVELEELYARIFRRMADDLTPLDLLVRDKILQYIITAVRPLQSSEVMNAIFTDLNAFIGDMETRASAVCGSLVKVEAGILKASHFSLRDFLQHSNRQLHSNPEIEPKRAHLNLAKTCLRYLSHPAFANFSIEFSDVDDLILTYPFLEYATLYWVHHVSQAEKSDVELQKLIRDFINLPGNAFFWADKLLPLVINRSVLWIPPRPKNNARFFHLMMLKSQLVNYFAGEEKKIFDEQISSLLARSYESALEEAQSRHGTLSTATLQRMMDLSEIYGWLPGKEARSAALLEGALQAAPKFTDAEGKELAIAVHQALADLYKREGKYEDAQKVLEKVLYLTEEHLQPDDVRVMFALDSLGWVKMRLNNLEGAVKNLRAALDIAEAKFGSMSPMTLRSKVALAEVLAKTNHVAEAEDLCVVLKEQVREHKENGLALPKDSVSQLNTLALVYKLQGRHKEAAETWEAVVDDRKKMFGDEGRMTLWATMQLAIAKKSAGNDDSAKQLFEQLLPRQEKVLGLNHPDVKETKSHLTSFESKVAT